MKNRIKGMTEHMLTDKKFAFGSKAIVYLDRRDEVVVGHVLAAEVGPPPPGVLNTIRMTIRVMNDDGGIVTVTMDRRLTGGKGSWYGWPTEEVAQ